MSKKKSNEKKDQKKHSKLTMVSFNFSGTATQWVYASMGFFVIFFYETVVGLNILYAMLAFVLYSIYNAINDPLMGYIMGKVSAPLEKKRHWKRFPWILISVGPWLFSFLLIYLVPLNWNPQVDPSYNLPVFLWMLISLCIYDTCISLFEVNTYSLFPDKFPDIKERKTVQSIGTILGLLGTTLAAIIPPMFITKGIQATYHTSSFVVFIGGFIFFALSIPGLWEDKQTLEQYKKRKDDLDKEKHESFLGAAKTVFRFKSAKARYVLTFGWQVAVVQLQYSGAYIVSYILDAEADTLTLLLLPMIIGAIIAAPIWLKISNRIGDSKKTVLYGGIVMFLGFIPMFFVVELIGWMISFFIFGIGLACQWNMENPIMGDIVDEAAVVTKKRQQGIFYGYQSFFVRIGHSSILITIAIVHVLTGFVEGAPTLTELIARSPTPALAIFGVRLHAAVIPAIILLVALVIFWRMYDLTPEKIDKNKEILQQYGL
jgi:GPH family glycoside/pentoside/hexuronide:cation symporter